ncbi:MAG: class I SAM-dependent methyltransferase [Planctomycetes bacterium]|nr:class I SAM-dependent methyltransferase [Planctomycetota bacterium]
MPRLHLFEFNDQPWLPEFLREAMVEAISRATRMGRLYDKATGAFLDLVRRSGGRRVLDLCSGAGGPASVLADAANQAGAAGVRITLSDLFPNQAAFEAVAARYPGTIDFRPEPVDATDVSPGIEHSVRTIVGAFHHFPPDLARRILESAVRDRKGIFVIEAFPRSVIRFTAMMPYFTLAALAGPFTAPKNRLLKFLVTYLVPVLWPVGLFDGIVSALRIYKEEEVESMGRALDAGYVWEFGVSPYPPWGRATWFSGRPAEWGDGTTTSKEQTDVG